MLNSPQLRGTSSVNDVKSHSQKELSYTFFMILLAKVPEKMYVKNVVNTILPRPRKRQGGDREINKDIPSKFFLRPERRD